MSSIGPIRSVLLPADLEARLPRPNSLRRASESAKVAVAAAAEALAGAPVTERTGLYVGLQQVPLDYCREFIDQSWRNGPRLASPMLFAESVANNAATHLSLTFGFRGSVQTFIGSRVAGIQALMAAAEDAVVTESVDAGLVVVLAAATSLTAEAYTSLYHPRARDRRPAPFALSNGAAAFLVRREPFPGSAELGYAGVRCDGRDAAGRDRALRGLWDDLRREGRIDPGPVAASVFCLARDRSLRAIQEAIGDVRADPPAGESFALDPFLQLAGGARTVAVLGEEGTAGVVSIDRPGYFLRTDSKSR